MTIEAEAAKARSTIPRVVDLGVGVSAINVKRHSEARTARNHGVLKLELFPGSYQCEGVVEGVRLEIA